MYYYICMQVIIDQCKKRKARSQNSITFDIADGDMLYISSIDKSLMDHGWIINQIGRLTVGNIATKVMNLFLNQVCASLWPAHAWFLKIAFGHKSSMRLHLQVIGNWQPNVVKQVQ